MVPADTAFGKDDGVPENQGPPTQAGVREAVNGFAGAVAAAVEQMAVAAERFATAAALALEQAEQRAGEARQSAGQAADHAGQVRQAIEAFKAELSARLEDAATAGEQAAARAREAADRAEEAARQAQAEAAGASEVSREVLRATEGVAANAAAAQQAAVAARESALAAVAAPPATVASDASELLERLETDYQLLTRLVQELHLRIGALAGVPEAQPAPVSLSAGAVDQRANLAPVGAVPPADAAAAGARLSGSILVTLKPVGDFDSLLRLDTALSGIEGVSRVNFADYVEEEVTFRVELGQPTHAASFTQRLSQAASTRAEIEAVGEASLSLRLSQAP